MSTPPLVAQTENPNAQGVRFSGDTNEQKSNRLGTATGL